MSFYDMHVHSRNSADSDLIEKDLVSRAFTSGLKGIGIVAHLDGNPADYCYNYFDPDRFDRDIRKAELAAPAGFRVFKGVEIGEPLRFADYATSRMSNHEYDFIIGALHWLEDDTFILEKDAFLKNPVLEIVENYYRELLDVVENCEFQILAHMGLFRRGIKKAGGETDFDETELWPALIKKLLGVLVDKNIALELNTSGLRREENLTYPIPSVLRMFKDLGGELVTLGSDSHRDPWVFYGLETGAEILIECGFRKACYYHKGQPNFYPLV